MKSLMVHGALAFLGLVGAYYAWTAEEPEERPQGEVVIADCDRSDLKRVRLQAEKKTVVVEIRKSGDQGLNWVTVTSSAPAAGTAARQQFVGNEALATYLQKLSPMRALRSLGNVPTSRFGELELDDPKTTFELSCGGNSKTLAVGGSTFGTADRYARDPKGGPVYLLASTVIRDLESAEFRFMQRELHRFALADVDEIRIEAVGAVRELLHRDRRDPQKAQWVDVKEPDRRNELYGNWLDRVLGLRVQSYLPPGRQPGSDLRTAGNVGPAFTLRYRAAGDEIGKLEIVKVETQPVEYYAKSETTRSWVKLPQSVAAEIDSDVRAVVGLEAAPARLKTKRPPPGGGLMPGMGGLPGH